MIVVRVAAGWTPEWPAFPIDRLAHHPDLDPAFTALDLAALLGPKDCPYQCDNGIHVHTQDGGYRTTCDCQGGKVPQRVALAIERPCETCHGNPMKYLDLTMCPRCTQGVRLVVEYTAQVDAVVPIAAQEEIVDLRLCRRYVRRYTRHAYLFSADAEPGWMPDMLPDADWSPGRWAVLTSDVQPITPSGRWTYDHNGPGPSVAAYLATDGIRHAAWHGTGNTISEAQRESVPQRIARELSTPIRLRSFPGPIANLEDVLA